MAFKTRLKCGLPVLLIIAAVLPGMNGCETVPSSGHLPPPAASTVIPPGLYHRVQKGETLWRIAKMYNTDLDELVKLNHISDVSDIEIGQLIFLPKPAKPVSRNMPVSVVDNEDFIWPLKGKLMVAFGRMHDNILNRGINIQAPENSDVVAARSGTVIFIYDDFLSFGKTIVIDHGDNFSTVYARNSQILVKTGDVIERGTLIAKVGSAGRNKSAYLHFQIRKGSLPQNPVFYLPR
ncbi:MAG: LysM peptidoglycan-binding domain-containing M23 family metallopeptidase [Candidatus Omnitrophica bacterium]|nr:LysM peptidoglycan-binding domain-containing M23 family metallopeptidase [Candidatus Omnitrophota bacterium]